MKKVKKMCGKKTRLIDADATIADLLTVDPQYETMIDWCCRVLDAQPTVDAEPVRHGKWIGYAGTIGNECSVCGKWLDVLQGTAEMNYCPNCGARMDND